MSENKKDLLSVLRKFVGAETKTELKAEGEVKLATETLDNGTIIEADSFEAGQAVAIVSPEEGEASVPLPAGDYLMADGMTLVVSEDGIIDEIKETEVEAEKEEVDAELKSESVSLEMFNELKALVEKLAEVKETNLSTELAAEKAKNVKLAAELADKADAPTIKAVPVELNAVAPVGIKEKIAAKLSAHRNN